MSLWSQTRESRHLIALVGALGLSVSACSKPVQYAQDQVAQNGPLGVQVEGVSLERIDVEGPAGAMELDRNALVVSLAITNTGETPLRWDPGFATTGVTQAQSVLLYAAPSWDAGLSPANNIATIATGAWHYLADPVREPVEVQPGETIRDIMLFSEPPSSVSNLILSVPPRLAGAEAKHPIFISIPYTAGEPKRAEVAQVGQMMTTADGVSFGVRGSEIAHQRVTNPDGSEAISKDPLLSIRFRVENKGDKPIEYIPTRMAAAKDFPALVDQNGAIQNRATFAAGVTPVGQISERRTLAPGESLEDFILFDRPTNGVTSLTLSFPGSRLGGSGLFRVAMPYTWSDPDAPAEFQPKK